MTCGNLVAGEDLNPRPLGYEPNDVRLCYLGWSLLANLTSADVRCEVVSGLGDLPHLTVFRRVRFTDPFTEQPVRGPC